MALRTRLRCLRRGSCRDTGTLDLGDKATQLIPSDELEALAYVPDPSDDRPQRIGAAAAAGLLEETRRWIDLYFRLPGPPPVVPEQVTAGKLRALAVTSARRWEGLPDVPTVGDFVPGYEATSLFGVGAPKATPVGIIDRLNREINAALEDPKLKTRLLELGGTLLPGSPADFSRLVADDTEKWGKVIRAVNIKAE